MSFCIPINLNVIKYLITINVKFLKKKLTSFNELAGFSVEHQRDLMKYVKYMISCLKRLGLLFISNALWCYQV
jgi:hypothetical protein